MSIIDHNGKSYALKLEGGSCYDCAFFRDQNCGHAGDACMQAEGAHWVKLDPPKIQGLEVTAVWLDEAAEIDPALFEAALRTTHKPMLLPADPAVRKGIPITSGVLDYFPLAIAEVAKCSKVGNDQHNPGQPLHWDKTKSMDHADCIPRHLIDRGTVDTDGVRHSAKLAWRSLALLQLELEADAARSYLV